MGPPALAPELTDHIIDFLHDDEEALRVCALTHPTWLPASRFHLFNTITVDGADGTQDRIALLDLHLLSEARVLSYVRTVKIVLISPERERRTPQLQDAVLFYRSIRRALSEPGSDPSPGDSMPRLPTAHLRLGSYCNLGEGGILPALSEILDKVTDLEFSKPLLSRRNDFWPFVSSFPALHSLKVTSLVFHHHGDERLRPQPQLKNIPLSKIRIDTMSMGFIIDSLLAYADVLTSLEEFGIFYEDVMQTALGNVAEAIRGKVKVLRFSARCHPGTEPSRNGRPSAFDLSM